MTDLPFELHILACMNRKRDQYLRQGRMHEARAVALCMAIVWENRPIHEVERPEFVDTVPSGLGDLDDVR